MLVRLPNGSYVNPEFVRAVDYCEKDSGPTCYVIHGEDGLCAIEIRIPMTERQKTATVDANWSKEEIVEKLEEDAELTKQEWKEFVDGIARIINDACEKSGSR